MKKWNARVVAAQVPPNLQSVFSDLIKGPGGDIDGAIKLTAECLDAMVVGDKLVVKDIIDADYTGEYTEWSFRKRAGYRFIVTRRERVYTGAGRTGYEIETFGEGTWSSDSVVQQVTYNPAKVTGYAVYPSGAYDTTIFFERR